MSRILATALLAALLSFAQGAAAALPSWGVELHDRLAPGDEPDARVVALTLDACGGQFDADLIRTLVALRVPATIFVTKKWLDRNPVGTAVLLSHPELFELEDHGTGHVPAFIGAGRRVYGIAGEPDAAHLEAEVQQASTAIRALTGRSPAYFRGATAVYDRESMQIIGALGYRIAGFSVNADGGARLPESVIVRRLRALQPGDIVIAHMNKPAGATAEAFATVLPQLQARGYRFITLARAQLLRH